MQIVTIWEGRKAERFAAHFLRKCSRGLGDFPNKFFDFAEQKNQKSTGIYIRAQLAMLAMLAGQPGVKQKLLIFAFLFHLGENISSMKFEGHILSLTSKKGTKSLR